MTQHLVIEKKMGNDDLGVRSQRPSQRAAFDSTNLPAGR